MHLDPKTVLEKARACLQTEINAIDATAKSLDGTFCDVIAAITKATEGGRKIILSGVGKSAHIAEKITGTLNSIGVPALFLDATQALHGDLGLCGEGDLALLLSNSGQSEEILRLCPMLHRFGVSTVAFTSNADSDLVRAANFRLLYAVPAEACPLKLAPTASTTAALALGDAVAMVLLELRGVTRDDFAKFHPAGNLGMVLLLKVEDIMRTGDRLPVLSQTASTQDAILAMTKAKAGSLALIDESSGKLAGIFTDGDFRRSALAGEGFLKKPVAEFMSRSPKTLRVGVSAVDAIKLFEKYKIDDLIVVDSESRPVGLIDSQDLPRLKVY